MGRTKKRAEPDEPSGAPEWMVTFSDCMTLLLTFFVLLLSFSSFDDRVFRKLKLIFCEALPTVSRTDKREKDAFLATKQIEPTGDLDGGSEKPTLARGPEDNLKEETEPEDFHSRKVFLISSKEVFWGKGIIISPQGRRTLSTMASFLRELPSRIVISENGPEKDESSGQLGLTRAWSVLEYLTTKQGLDKNWFSISAASMAAQESSRGDEPGSVRPEAERMLEIVLLERSIYN